MFLCLLRHGWRERFGAFARMRREGVYAREHVDLFVLLVQQVLQFPDFGLQAPHAVFQRLGVAAWKGPAAQLVAGLALKANVGALCATRPDAVASWPELVRPARRATWPSRT
jgi:hypothetical protein